MINFMIYASYHSRLEISFCMDEYLMPPPRIDEIDFDLDSIKYKRKSIDNGSLQHIVLDKNLKNRLSKEKVKDMSGETEDLSKNYDGSYFKAVEASQKLEQICGANDSKDTKETDLQKTEKETSGNIDSVNVQPVESGQKVPDKISARTSNKIVESDRESVEKSVATDDSKDLNSSEEKTKSVRDFIDSKDQSKADSELTKGSHEFQTLSERDTNGETYRVNETSVCSNVEKDDEKDTLSSGTVLDAKDDRFEIKQIQNIVTEGGDHTQEHKHFNETANREKITEDKDKYTSVNKDDKRTSVKQNTGLPDLNLDLKQICDNNLDTQTTDTLKSRCVSSPNFEHSSYFQTDQSNSDSVQTSQSEFTSSNSPQVTLRRVEIERTTLKECMSESVIRCDKSGANSDKSPFLRRKVESTCLTDQSDPLQSYQKSQDDSIFQSSLPVEEQMQKNRFKLKKALEYIILSISPYIHYDLPYLETDQGSRCELRKYFPEEIYWSHHFR